MKQLYIVGAGGHSKVVLDALELSQNINYDIVLVEDDPNKIGTTVLEYPIIGPLCTVVEKTDVDQFHIAIGDNAVRSRLYAKIQSHSAKNTFLSVIHPSASVSPRAKIGQGIFLASNCVVAPCATIGDGTIVNHGASIDHDCVVGSFAHIAPNAVLCGTVSVGEETLVGANAVILPGIRVGRGVTIGAGSVVTRDIPDLTRVKGNPAKPFH